jgi:tripartite-type tricarboxylate transporter receptor subunit TctC
MNHPADLSRRRALFAAGLALAGAGVRAQAPAFPQRAVKLIVPYGAGSSVDIVTRLYAQRFSTALGQPVIVENKPGGGTMIGSSTVAHAAADGYTLLVGSNSLSIMPHLGKQDFDPLKDLLPVGPLFNTSIVLLAKPAFPANNLTELAALAKRQPGKLSYSTWGIGTSAHLVMELFRDQADIDILHVPYKGGGAESAGAVIAGNVDMGFDTTYTALPRVRSGQLKALGVFSPERVEGFDNVQTAGEAGYPESVLLGWVGVFAPKGTPAAVLQKLVAAGRDAAGDAAFGARLREMGSKPFAVTPEGMTDNLRSESERVQRIVAKRKIKME